MNLLSEAPIDPNESPSKDKTFMFTDLVGFGKIIDKLNLQKLNTTMTYCIISAILILSFFGAMYKFRSNLNDFPNLWDMRLACISSIVIIIYGLFDYRKKRRT